MSNHRQLEIALTFPRPANKNYTISEAATMLCITVGSLRNALRKGRVLREDAFYHYRDSRGRVWIPARSFDTWVEAWRRHETPPQWTLMRSGAGDQGEPSLPHEEGVIRFQQRERLPVLDDRHIHGIFDELNNCKVNL